MAPDLQRVFESLTPPGPAPADRLPAVLARAARRRRRTQAASVALSVVAVTAVVVVAGSGSRTTGPNGTPITHPTVGSTIAPDQVVFGDDQHGYAVYDRTCPGVTGVCTPRIFATTDGARTWHPVTLPTGTPLGAGELATLQAAGSDVLMVWSNGAWVSTDSGTRWKAVRVGSVQSATFVQSHVGVQIVDAARATMATLPLPQGLSSSGPNGGLLPGGRVWVSAGSDFDVSPDAGRTWTKVALPPGESPIGVSFNGAGAVFVLTGRPEGEVVLAKHLVTLTGRTTTLQGPGVLPGCTAMLADGSLLAIGQADGLPYRLPAGGNTFVRDLAGPSVRLGCLESRAGVPLWATATDNRLWVSSEGRTWRSAALPRVSAAPLTVPSAPATTAGELTPGPDTTTPGPARTAVRADLVGSPWVLVEVDATQRPSTPRVPHLLLAADGTYVGSDGCNGVGGPYETGPGTVTLLGQVTTSAYCPGEDHYPFTTATAGRMSATVQGSELALTGSDGTTLVFQREP
jgi:heat shock protein HslJ